MRANNETERAQFRRILASEARVVAVSGQLAQEVIDRYFKSIATVAEVLSC